MMNLIMLLGMYPVVFILYFVYRAMGLEHNRYVFGITLMEGEKKSETIQEITKVYKKQMRALFLVSAFLPFTAFLTTYVSIQFTIWIFWLLGTIVAYMVPYVIANGRVASYKEETRKENKERETEDSCWKWGLFYYNKNDKRKLVDARYGIGMSSNMAGKTGKASAVIAILSLIWIPFLCGYMIIADFTPIHLSVKEQKVICEHTNRYYTIPLESIEEVDLINELPRRSKISGTATNTIEKGKFSVSGYGRIFEFLNPEQGLFLYIGTEDRGYLVSGYSDKETRMVYERIKKG